MLTILALLTFVRTDPVVPAASIPGSYYQGDGLGVNLSLDLLPSGRFTYSWHGCLGEYDTNAGTWKLDGDKVVLIPLKPHEMQGFQGMNLRLIPVKWGDRTLLVDEYEMAGFSAEAQLASTPDEGDIHGDQFVKVGKGFKAGKCFGKPILPGRYQDYYDGGNLDLKVAGMRKDGFIEIKGWDARLAPGMRLGSRDYEVELTSVGPKSCAGRVWYYWNSDELPKAGDEIGFERRGTGFRRYVSLTAARKAAKAIR